MSVPAPGRRWNHNIHYHHLVLDAVSSRAGSALDVGCGDGLLTLDLSERVPEVVGIDLDATVLETARQEAEARESAAREETPQEPEHGSAAPPANVVPPAPAGPVGPANPIAWIHDDVMTHDFGRTFDLVASIATVHHLPDLEATLTRLAALTSPGGSLVIVGLARESTLRDRLYSLAGVMRHRWLIRRLEFWEHTAPLARPEHDYSTVRTTAARVLPGVQWKQLLLWRYALIWHKPE